MADAVNNSKIYSTVSGAMKLNEAVLTSGRYVLEGIFAELGVMNVNHRIYTEEEYLRHLQYLREDVKKGDLLGELDHPEDRFEVKLKEASHRIIDIWYDQPSKMVMGKIELLDTPNGILAKGLVDAGIPLHISSRAAGTINKDNTVSIQQIYTYDLVAKPGFAKATLHRVNESVDSNKYSDKALDFLKRSEVSESANTIEASLLNEGFYTDNSVISSKLRKEALDILENKDCNIDMDELTKHINESDTQTSEAQDSSVSAYVPAPDMTLEGNEGTDDKDTKKDGEGDDAGKNGDGENKSDDKKDDKDDYEIIDVKKFEEPDENKENDKEGDEDGKDGDDDKDKDGEGEDGDKKDDKKSDENADDASEAKNEKKPADTSKMIFDKKDELQKRTEKFSEQFDALVKRVKTKNKVTEAQVNALAYEFPFTKYLSESSLTEFSKLSDNKKRKVRDYLSESSIVDCGDIDKVWRNGLNESVTAEPIWLAKATEEYRELYNATTDAKRAELNECAKFLNFNTQADIDSFWNNSDLKTMRERQMMYESFMGSTPNISTVHVSNDLPYSMENVMKHVALYS